MATDFLQAMVILRPNADADEVRRWFESRGFGVLPMENGMVLTGVASLVEQAFGAGLEIAPMRGVERPLPIPADLRDHIESIAIPSQRSTR
jgi:hypothetical protein